MPKRKSAHILLALYEGTRVVLVWWSQPEFQRSDNLPSTLLLPLFQAQAPQYKILNHPCSMANMNLSLLEVSLDCKKLKEEEVSSQKVSSCFLTNIAFWQLAEPARNPPFRITVSTIGWIIIPPTEPTGETSIPGKPWTFFPTIAVNLGRWACCVKA